MADRADRNIHKPVITGIGAVAPCGNTCEEIWRNIAAGKSAIDTVELDRTGQIPAAVIDKNFSTEPGRSVRFAIEAARQAMTAAMEKVDEISSYFSSSKGDMITLEKTYTGFLENQADGIPENFLSGFMTSAPSSAIAKEFRLGKRNLNFPAACATGLISIALAADHISSGRESIILAGATEASITALIMAGFKRMGVLADHDHSPRTAMRPFDQTRSGFVIGEGAGALLIESMESATARCAPIYAQVAGSAFGCDWQNMVRLENDYDHIAEIISKAVENAGIAPEDLDYINLHGTATALNDIFETGALKAALGPAASTIPASSTKPVTGHLLGACGAVETIITVLAMRNEFIPPTLNLNNPDPRCSLCHVPRTGLKKEVRHALIVNYGFGGHVAAIVLRNAEQAK
jgi:3-oxoacyl-[acyl-carrier-protein] synthase II